MANDTLKEWFSGPRDDTAVMPKFLSLQLGNMQIAVETAILLVLAIVANSLVFGLLGLVVWLVWVGLLVLFVWSLLAGLRIGNVKPPVDRLATESATYVPKWYARAITVAGAFLVVAIVLGLLF